MSRRAILGKKALGLPLGLEAPVMTSNGVLFLFFLLGKSPLGRLALMHSMYSLVLHSMSWSIVLLQLPLLCPPASLLEKYLGLWNEMLLQHIIVLF